MAEDAEIQCAIFMYESGRIFRRFHLTSTVIKAEVWAAGTPLSAVDANFKAPASYDRPAVADGVSLKKESALLPG